MMRGGAAGSVMRGGVLVAARAPAAAALGAAGRHREAHALR